MSQTTTTRSQPTTAPDFTWIDGKNARWDSIAVSASKDRAFIGLKGFDKHHGPRGYISVELDAAARDRLVAALQALKVA